MTCTSAESHPLEVLKNQGLIDLWVDDGIKAGEDWYGQIQAAMDKANIAVLLISANFLTSRFVLDEEIPRLLFRRQREGLLIFPVMVEPCDWKAVGWLERMQMRPKNARPLSAGPRHRAEESLTTIAAEIRNSVKQLGKRAVPDGNLRLAHDGISISRLPSTGHDLFGREQEVDLLNRCWENGESNVVTVVSWGGVGKTALVNHWLWRLAQRQYAGAERVYAWSFYSQGCGDRIVAADEFIESALKQLGETAQADCDPWSKGERLARALQSQRALLVLDGLEPVQYPPGGPQDGFLKDQALRSLLRQLAAFNPGLCVISTRLPVRDLLEFEDNTALRIELEHLSDEAGGQLLRSTGVWAHDSTEFEQASRELGGHCLALTLLGSYLTHAYGGDLRRRDTIGPLTDDVGHGAHALRVLRAYESWFQAAL